MLIVDAVDLQQRIFAVADEVRQMLGVIACVINFF